MKKLYEEIKPKTCAFLFAGIILLAIVMRLVGISWGMPYGNLHPDEGIVYYPAYQCALERNIDVHGSYYRPDHVSIKASALIYMAIQDFYFTPRGMEDFASNYSNNFGIYRAFALSYSRHTASVLFDGRYVGGTEISKGSVGQVAVLDVLIHILCNM